MKRPVTASKFIVVYLANFAAGATFFRVHAARPQAIPKTPSFAPAAELIPESFHPSL